VSIGKQGASSPEHVMVQGCLVLLDGFQVVLISQLS